MAHGRPVSPLSSHLRMGLPCFDGHVGVDRMEQEAPRGPSGQGPDSAAIARAGSCIPRWRGMGGASRYMAASGCRLLRSGSKLHPRIGCPDSPPPAGDRGALRFAERSDLLTHLRRRRTSASHRNPRRSGLLCPPRAGVATRPAWPGVDSRLSSSMRVQSIQNSFS